MSPQELDKLAKVCRKHGITRAKIDGMTVELTFDPYSPTVAPTNKNSSPVPEAMETEEMTPEQVLLWSATPHELPE